MIILSMYMKIFILKKWPVRLWDLDWWIWNQEGRPAGWNLRQELTLLSWGRISFSSRKPQVFLFRPLTDWMRPPQCWGWSPLLPFSWWMWATFINRKKYECGKQRKDFKCIWKSISYGKVKKFKYLSSKNFLRSAMGGLTQRLRLSENMLQKSLEIISKMSAVD